MIIFLLQPSFNNSEGLRTIINTKGLKSMLGDCSKSQTEIIKFIESCKKMRMKKETPEQTRFKILLKIVIINLPLTFR